VAESVEVKNQQYWGYAWGVETKNSLIISEFFVSTGD